MTRRRWFSSARIDVQMTPLIDVVFQLLAFFLMTFRGAAPEGDVSLRLPKHDSPPGGPRLIEETIRVRLTADADGGLAALTIDDHPAEAGPAAFDALRRYAERFVATARAADMPDPVVELDADDGLRYELVMQATTAVAGRIDEHGDRVPLITKIRLKRP